MFGFAQAQLDSGKKCMVLGDMVDFIGDPNENQSEI